MAEEMDSEILLEVKKKQLLADLEGGAIFKGKSFLEVVDDSSNRFAESNEPEIVCENATNSTRQFKTDENQKKKRPRRKGKDSLKGLEKNQTKLNEAEIYGRHSSCQIEAPKYSRQQMEAMRFMNIVEQRNFWTSVYNGLEAAVVKEYEDLSCLKTKHSNFEPKQRFGTQDLHGEVSSKNSRDGFETTHVAKRGIVSLGSSCSHDIEGEGPKLVVEGAYSEENDSDDDDHASIQRPAFYVDGEPDFESGPPEDGLEYLRRVRWEAARIPKVKVAKIDKHKINKEQSVYMPQIPDIPKCPDHLLPSKVWEDAFLVDFSQLRLLLARDEDDPDSWISHKPPSHLPTANNIILEKCNQHDGMVDKDKSVASFPGITTKAKVDESSDIYPTLSLVRAMDSVSRVSSLKKRIIWAERASSLTKNECMWLFALCAAVDTPLLADTSAAIRSLLRKCASLRAAKSELDDEVVMFNILATVCGRYFGQAED